MSLLICVDENNQQIDLREKLEVHQLGLLHQAFSIFIFDENRPDCLLLQKRALSKYHCAGQWTNTCCGHLVPNEELIETAQARLQEEMGFSCSLTYIDKFTYYAQLTNGLIEHEIDSILVGAIPRKSFIHNQEEVDDWDWKSIQDIYTEGKNHPQEFTPWFFKALAIVRHKMKIHTF